MNKKVLPVIGSLLVLITAGIVFTIVYCLRPKTTIVAFYNFNEKQKNAVISILDSSLQDGYEILNLNDDIPLSKQAEKIKKASIILTNTNADVRDFALNSKFVKPISKDFSSEMPLSISSTLQSKDSGYSYIPFLYDMYEIDVNYDLLSQTPVKNIVKWDDLLSLASEEIKITNTPVSFSAADDVEYLNIFGQLYEVYSTHQKYDSLYSGLYDAFKKDYANDFKTSNCEEYINDMLQNNNEMKICINNINDMFAAKQINENTLKQTEQDTLFLCNNGFAGITFLKLSDHRKINRDIIGHYKSIFFPSLFADDNRKFAAQEYSILLLKDNEVTQNLIKVFTDTQQSELSSLTGLSPVQKNSQVPDRQADDVRYWLAASLGPLPPLATAIPERNTQKAIAALLKKQVK